MGMRRVGCFSGGKGSKVRFNICHHAGAAIHDLYAIAAWIFYGGEPG